MFTLDYGILTPDKRAHDWVVHASPKCMECRACKTVVGSDCGVQDDVPIYGCTHVSAVKVG